MEKVGTPKDLALMTMRKKLMAYCQPTSGRIFITSAYLTASKNRAETRGTEMQKHIQRVSIVMSVNTDGSLAFLVHHIGRLRNPICLRSAQFIHLKSNYLSQPNGWMDSKGFEYWLRVWYNPVQRTSEGPWCLLMDNCGNHEFNVTLEGLKIVFLPARSTDKHHPIDLGVIPNAKIRYRSALLSPVLNVIEKRRTTHEKSPNDSESRRYGIREVKLSHVADAMVLF